MIVKNVVAPLISTSGLCAAVLGVMMSIAPPSRFEDCSLVFDSSSTHGARCISLCLSDMEPCTLFVDYMGRPPNNNATQQAWCLCEDGSPGELQCQGKVLKVFVGGIFIDFFYNCVTLPACAEECINHWDQDPPSVDGDKVCTCE